MAEEKGYPLIVKISLPPTAQYAQGHSLIVQSNTVDDLASRLAVIAGGDSAEVGHTMLKAFGERLLSQAAGEVLNPGSVIETPDPTPEKSPEPAKPSPASSAPAEGGASAALIKVAADRSGKSVEELAGITTAEAQRLMKGEA